MTLTEFIQNKLQQTTRRENSLWGSLYSILQSGRTESELVEHCKLEIETTDEEDKSGKMYAIMNEIVGFSK